MIVDNARVALADGTTKQAIDLFPSADLLSFRDQKPRKTRLMDRKIENHTDAICLVLANGERLIGSCDQRVCVCREKQTSFMEMSNVEIGMNLRGQAAGMLTNVRVIGVLLFPKHAMRMVQFQFETRECFVAEGILCR